MASLSEIQARIEDTNATIAVMERSLATVPRSPSILANIRSLQARQRILEEEFVTAAADLGVDVCSYRFFGEGEGLKAGPLGEAISVFQQLVSIVYAAIITKEPRQRSTVPAELAAASAFGFGYAYPGSIGIVLTLRNEQLLFGDSTIDEAITQVFEMAEAKDPGEIAGIADLLGPASVRELYKWSDIHATAGVGADIQWRKRDEVRQRLLMQVPQLEQLRAAINETSDEDQTELEIDGLLVGIDTKSRSFHFLPSVGEEVRGRFADGFEPRTVTVPVHYWAKIVITSRQKYSTGDVENTYRLESLSPRATAK